MADLNDIYHMLNPETHARLTKNDCKLSNWAFWSDQRSEEHVQFAAYKCKQKMLRAKEEYDYTQREILSVLDWNERVLEEAAETFRNQPYLGQQMEHASMMFCGEQHSRLLERRNLWEKVLRPHLTITLLDLNTVD